MSTTETTRFDSDTLRQAVENRSAATLVSLYADDAELRIVDRSTQPSNPMVLRGREQIAEMIGEIYERDLTHSLDQCVVEGDRAAFAESCRYPDGVRVLAESMVSLRDGKIVEQTMIQAWDD
ncbi:MULTISPECIES: nuclear transport factor 2 family protein [unclassified Streptomyces]|uniref:nuclear transport factor 2 family protein n=1 Tax=unclassified Streptomyces TaxID=2593676 RepID=UPI001907BAD7|nr:nuclear transport factor 2 family protein [Streptomyces sp. HSG2]